MFRKISRYIHPDKTKDFEKHEAFNKVKELLLMDLYINIFIFSKI